MAVLSTSFTGSLIYVTFVFKIISIIVLARSNY